MARRRPILRLIGRLMLAGLAIGAVVLVFRQGLIPAQFSPLPPIDLASPSGWFIDWRLAELKRSRALCERALKSDHIKATPVADSPIKNGCGWENAVRVTTVGGASLSVDKLTCETAAAFTLWLAHEVQPLAEHHLGTRVASVQHMGSYSCRNIIGSRWLGNIRSEHATANALDIAGFRLADGRQVSVLRHWNGTGPETQFLRDAHKLACRYFRVAIGPEYNKEHRDHFHYDRGPASLCR